MFAFFVGFILAAFLTVRLLGWLGLAVVAVVVLAGLSGTIVKNPGPVCRFLNRIEK